jgi:hypothetical protein
MNRCHRCGEICCRCWLALVLVAVLLIGCKTSEPKQSHQVPMPPLPRTTRSSAGGEVGHVDRAFIGPPAPKKLKLVWEKNDTHPDTITEIWEVNSVTGEKTYITETSGTTIELWADKPAQFFIVRNRLYDLVSEWNQ